MSWDEQAACRGLDPEWFLEPDTVRGGGGMSPATEAHIDRARGYCAGCPVQVPCLAEVAHLGPATDRSIRAGLTPSQREELRGGRAWPELQPIQHGTTAGYRAHYRRFERPCDACRAAHMDAHSLRARRSVA